MRTSIPILLSTLLFIAPASTSAQVPIGCERPAILTSPFAFATVDGECTDLSAFITPVIGGTGWNLLAHVTLSGSTMDLNAFFDPDPSITFGGTTLQLSSEMTTYSFLFGLPIVPDFYTSALGRLSLTVTSPQGSTTVDNSTVNSTFLSGFGSAGAVFTNLAVDLGTDPCVASGTAATTTCDQGTATNSFAPTYFDNLEALVTYTQDNRLSTASFTGEVRVDAVTVTPEPATLGLVGLGILVLGAAMRRSTNRSAVNE